MSVMTEAAAVPAWVRRMRAAGHDVRIGIGTGDLPEDPEVDFGLPARPRSGLHRRVNALARKLWQRDWHPAHSLPDEGHAALP
jgi:hypothetical protein